MCVAQWRMRRPNHHAASLSLLSIILSVHDSFAVNWRYFLEFSNSIYSILICCTSFFLNFHLSNSLNIFLIIFNIFLVHAQMIWHILLLLIFLKSEIYMPIFQLYLAVTHLCLLVFIFRRLVLCVLLSLGIIRVLFFLICLMSHENCCSEKFTLIGGANIS